MTDKPMNPTPDTPETQPNDAPPSIDAGQNVKSPAEAAIKGILAFSLMAGLLVAVKTFT